MMLNKYSSVIIGSVIILLLAIYVYGPITHLGFASPDDHWMLLKNEYVHPLHYSGDYFTQVFSRVNSIQYSPINTLYYSLIYNINGYDPYYYHSGNFIFHLLNCLCIFFLCRKLLSLFDVVNTYPVSFIAALIWCIHPLNVEVVTWVSGSKIILCTLFTLISFLLFLNKYYTLSAIAVVLSCLCKEQGMITPIMFLLFKLLYNWKYKISMRGESKFVVFILSLFLFSFIFGVFTIHVNAVDSENYTPITQYPVYQRILLYFYCMNFYLCNLVIPVNLHYHYPFPFPPLGKVPISFYLFPVFFLALCIFLIFTFKKSPQRYLYLLLVGILLSQLSLELQIIPMTRPAVMADRYMYFPAFAILLALLTTLNINIMKRSFPFLVLYAICLSIYSHHLVENWYELNLIQ